MNKKILVGLTLGAVILVGGIFWFIFQSKNRCGDGICQDITCLAIGCPRAESAKSCPQDCANNLTACTEEAKICSDGSSVVRTGPNCEFAPCPEEVKNSICKNLCGDGACQERVCMGTGCPCAETAASCPQDCPKNPGDDLSVCTEEAKICPDGSSVVRIGPDCEFADCPGTPSGSMVGNDADEHGCLGSAGYSWCEAKQKCLRTWEEKCVK